MSEIPHDLTAREIIRGLRGFEHSPSDNDNFDSEINLLVRAGAGSGKTTALVERMVALVRCGTQVEHIAAITFTMKAASEMRERFFLALSECRATMKGDSSDPEVQYVDAALQQVDAVFIDTIHSFCTRLLRERPLVAGIAPDFSIIDDREEESLARSFWNGYLAREMQPGSVAYDSFREVGLDATSLFEHFRERVRLAHIPRDSSTGTCPDMVDATNEVIGLVNRIAEIMPPVVAKDPIMELIDSVGLFLQVRGTQKREDQAALLTMIDSLVSPEGKLKRGKLKKRTWYRSKKDPIAANVDAIMEPADGSDSPFSIPSCVVTHIRPVLNQWWAYLDGIIDPFVSGAVEEFRSYRRKAGKLSFADLLILAADLLRTHPSVRIHFRRRFRRLLVDEFQDTDPKQAELLFLLTATDPGETNWKNCVPRPGSLFVVGDDKQSIFRFRDADLRIFSQIEDLMVKTGGSVLTLTSNFRSAPRLCKWNNQALAPLFESEEAPYQAPYHELISAPGNSNMPGAVMQLVTTKISRHRAGDVAKQEADRIASIINQAVITGVVNGDPGQAVLEGLGFGDVMILVREGKRMQTYADALERQSIPYTIAGGKALGSAFILAPLLDLLDTILNPHDPVATIAYLRGPLAGISDAALSRFVSAGGRVGGNWDVPESLVGPDVEVFRNAFETLQKSRHWLHTLSASEAIGRMAIDRGILASLSCQPGGSAAAGSFQRILSKVRDWEGSGLNWAEILGELHRLKNGDLQMEAMTMEIGLGAAVQILNIHQAKGLEARMVFLADPLGGKPKKDVKSHVFRSESGPRLVMPVCEAWGAFSSKIIARPLRWDDAISEELRFGEAEKLRLLYVAATRAAEVLIVSRYTGHEEDGKDSMGTWAVLYPGLERAGAPEVSAPQYDSAHTHVQEASSESEKGAFIRYAQKLLIESQETIRDLSSPTYSREIASELVQKDDGRSVRTGRSSDSVGGPGGAAFGTLVHALFEWIVLNRSQPDLRNAAENVLESFVAGVYAGSDPEDRHGAAEAAMRAYDLFVGSGIWREVNQSPSVHPEISFSVRKDEVHDSESIPGILGGVIDLVYNAPGGWVIVDFKTDLLAPDVLVDRYREQIDAYAFAWESLTGEKVFQKGFFSVGSGEFIPVSSDQIEKERV